MDKTKKSKLMEAFESKGTDQEIYDTRPVDMYIDRIKGTLESEDGSHSIEFELCKQTVWTYKEVTDLFKRIINGRF